MGEEYRPIACPLHDRLEEAATLRRVVRIEYRAECAVEIMDDVIADISARQGVEYLTTRRGCTIRLDQLVSVDGVPFGEPS
jgi:Rho-binding antiterminator